MASTPYQNPGSNEVQSPLIAGLSEGLKKVSEILNLKTAVVTDIPLTVVEGNRIYEASQGNKLWLDGVEFQLKKNGTVLSKETTSFTVDYLGGSVTFDKPLLDEDKLTVTVKRISNDSATINDILENIAKLQGSIGQYKGYFNTYEELSAQHPTGVDGEYGFVATPNFAMYAWNKAQGKWRNTQSVEDLSKYYDKNKVDELLSAKQPTISFTQKATDFYAGDGSFRDLATDVRASKLTGLSTEDISVATANDSLITGLGKVQGQITNLKTEVGKTAYLSGAGEPNTSTKGEVGQRYIDTATGKTYICTKVADGTYTWTVLENYNDTQVKADIVKNADDITGLTERVVALENITNAEEVKY